MNGWQKTGLALGTLVLGVLAFGAIQATGQQKVQQDTSRSVAPLVQVATLSPQQYQFELAVWAEVIPQEQTRLTPEVTGRVVAMHPEFIDGGLLKKGDVMVQLDDADYQAQFLSAEAAVAAATANLEQELALAKVAKEENRNVSPALLTSLALRKPQLQSAEAALKSAQAALQKAKRDLARTKIVAPYDALIVQRHIGLGQVVNSGSVLADLNNIEFAEIRLPVASFDLPFLPAQLKGIPASVRVDGQSRQGLVVRDLGVLQSKTRMHHLVVQIEDPYALRQSAPRLRFGSYVEVLLTGSQMDNVYVLPQDSVNNQQVWLVDKQNKLQLRTVTVLRQQGKEVLIRDGLNAGEQLVVTPPSFPQDGLAVRIETNTAALAKRSQ